MTLIKKKLKLFLIEISVTFSHATKLKGWTTMVGTGKIIIARLQSKTKWLWYLVYIKEDRYFVCAW